MQERGGGVTDIKITLHKDAPKFQNRRYTRIALLVVYGRRKKKFEKKAERTGGKDSGRVKG